MVDETNISQEIAAVYEQRAQRVIENLKRRKMNGLFAATRADALKLVLDMVPADKVVARGDGITLEQIGLVAALKERKQNVVIDPFQTDENGHWPPPVDRLQMMRETFFADIFITGTNAITLDGKLVNIDGAGNRVSAMIFGPSKVIIVTGANKIVKDAEEGLQRIHQWAAPVNAKRHSVKHHDAALAELPCVKTGSCVDCRNDWRICNYVVIIEGAMAQHVRRMNVVIVGEELGI